MLMSNVWGSITVLVNEMIDDFKVLYPDVDIRFCDWEAHANIQELPDADLIGPSAVTFMDSGNGMVEVNFAIAVSTYSTDTNLFRLRDYVGRLFERVRPERQITFYNAEDASELSFMICTDGTMVAPLSKAEVRPFQYVQVAALLEPTGSEARQ